jgi:polygalacturonase
MRFPLNSSAAIAVISFAALATAGSSAPAESSDWSEAATILARIVPPVFPKHDFNVTEFGAKGDGATDNRAAFAQAIAMCAKQGGGRVVVPPGTFFCDGPIHLESNINLHVSEGATIKFGANPAQYLPPVLTRFEGTLLMGHSPRIYAKGATNIAITGNGVIDGNARDTFALFKTGKGRGNAGELRKMGAEGTPVEQRIFGEGRWLRPSTIQPFDCTNVLIEDVTVRDSTFWVVHPVLCRNITVRGIKVDSMNANNDGCDPDSCRDVLIENCDFHTGDDAIAIKSGRDQDGWKVGQPSENIVIRHCVMRSKWSALCIGSEMSGGVRNVFMEDCQVAGAASAFYFKANLDRGGLVEHVRARRLTVDDVREPLIRFETSYHGWRGENHPPSFRDFIIEDLTCHHAATYGIYIEGVESAPIRDVVVRRVTVDQAEGAVWLKRAENIHFEDVKINGAVQPMTPPETPESAVKLKMSS